MPGKQWANTDKESVKQLLKHRHECEVRYLLKYRHDNGLEKIRLLLALSGFEGRLKQIQIDMADQWRKGNRGTVKGMWL